MQCLCVGLMNENNFMAGTKEQLKKREQEYIKKLNTALPQHKAFWERQLKYVRKQLYGQS